MSEFYDPEVLSHLQKVEMLILKDFMAICEKHNLTYFGCAGTGIGALRHQGFIPWDDDIDIALPREDYEKLIKAVEEEYGDKYHMLNTANDINYPLATTRMCLNGTVFHEHAVKNVDCDWGIFLDLYALDNAADGKLAFKWQMWCTWFWSKILILRSMPKPYLAFKGAKAKVVYVITSMISTKITTNLNKKKQEENYNAFIDMMALMIQKYGQTVLDKLDKKENEEVSYE